MTYEHYIFFIPRKIGHRSKKFAGFLKEHDARQESDICYCFESSEPGCSLWTQIQNMLIANYDYCLVSDEPKMTIAVVPAALDAQISRIQRTPLKNFLSRIQSILANRQKRREAAWNFGDQSVSQPPVFLQPPVFGRRLQS